jgi:cobyrinic acid a,c-diamide synthase
MARCTALVIAAPASGQGKTTVTAALARLHARQGRRVRVFKCGPDYLDPHWHQLASGAPVHQLDLWMTGEADCAQRLAQAAAQADLLLVEGVMGLFDGEHSVAALARRFGMPVLAVVDAGAMGGTLGAVVHGLRHYWADLPWAGVLANRVAGERHADMLRAGLRDGADWLGALPRLTDAAAGTGEPGGLLPERHLGLVGAQELPDALQRLDAAADALAATPLGRMDLQALQRFAVDFAAPVQPTPVPPLLAGRTVAVAQDAAFCFVYDANLDTLRSLGARVALFAPLRGDPLPACDAVWLPGGYPELHADTLAANTALREALRAHVGAGRPVWAECGGMLALLESLTLAKGRSVPLWGLLPGRAAMRRRLAALGPREVLLDGVDGAQALRGHTFHYSTTDSPATACAHTRRPGEGAADEPVYRHGSIRASYFHAWFASSPRAVAALFTQAP